MEVRDYNGTGIWTWDVVVNRYNDYARRLGILNIRDLKPKMFVEGDEKRIVGMLLAGNVPHEFKEYSKLLRRIGVGGW
jgi:hypothetical protein